jgi:hypothetical protein
MKRSNETLSFPDMFREAFRRYAKKLGRKKSHLVVERIGPEIAAQDAKFKKWFDAYTTANSEGED